MSNLTKTTWLDADQFYRIKLAFQLHGIRTPSPDVDHNGQSLHGAYVSNIVNQYRASLTEKEVLAIIAYGLYYEPEEMQAEIARGWIAPLYETVLDYDERNETDEK